MRASIAAFLVAPLALCTASATAHPGIGIVMDSRGAVYYTDLKQVWKISPEGSKTVAVSGVHTHELWIDRKDALYGEHLWYEGDASGKWGHRVWCLTADGELADLIPARPGFRDDYDDFHFVRAGDGTMFWKDGGEDDTDRGVIRRRPPGGRAEIVTDEFRNVSWLHATPQGTLFFAAGYDLIRIDPGNRPRKVAVGLAAWNWRDVFGPRRHAIMGIWSDPATNVYVAMIDDRVVKRVTPEGSVSVVARSQSPWIPVGGVAGQDGSLWILESGERVRVRRIEKNGTETLFE